MTIKLFCKTTGESASVGTAAVSANADDTEVVPPG